MSALDSEKYLKKLSRQIQNPKVRDEVMKEYKAHIEDCKEALMMAGMNEKEAKAEAVRQMGDPVEAGKQMNGVYHTLVDWKKILWFLICAIFIYVSAEVLLWGIGRGYTVDYEGGEHIIKAVGMFLAVYGLVVAAVERYHSVELFYAHARDWGRGVANSGVILGVSVLLLAWTIKDAIMVTLILCLIQILLHCMMAKFREYRMK